ncbi:unnamed protein product [Staurois parvus]|uniref:Uncharacterized protein n=1 Tax=Staurois parvus TaxID=386267 RepID=A0ABN9DMA3_9NEOB|nr:unnamed protein product [Staurois parvus]
MTAQLSVKYRSAILQKWPGQEGGGGDPLESKWLNTLKNCSGSTRVKCHIRE